LSITPLFFHLPRRKGFPWNLVLALEIKNANDGPIGPKRSLTITYTYVTDGWTDIRTNGHGMTAKTSLTRSVLWLKRHQIVLMCCCTASIIHTYLLQCPIDSNSKLLNTIFSILALGTFLWLSCGYSYSSLPGISLRGANVPGNIRSLERKFLGTFVPGSECCQWELSLRGAQIPGSEKSLNHLY